MMINTIQRFLNKNLGEFVPKHSPVHHNDIILLQDFILRFNKILVLTGAGISTESGIPDYRSEGVGLYARSDRRPVLYNEFLKSDAVRQRYWARNFLGWPKFSQSKPNTTHYAIHILENKGKISSIVTQNVDGLHLRAGSRNVIELHGTAFRVICMGCGKTFKRYDIQDKLAAMNSGLQESTDIIRPDGDIEIEFDKIRDFKPPFCDCCGGILKPDITFFGDNIPKSRLDAVRECLNHCDSVLVLGSSLTVFSAYRIILQASASKKYIAIVNIGSTRGDKHANLKISAKCGDIFLKIISQLDKESGAIIST